MTEKIFIHTIGIIVKNEADKKEELLIKVFDANESGKRLRVELGKLIILDIKLPVKELIRLSEFK